MRRIVALLLALIVLAVGAVLALAWIAADSILRPVRQAITRLPSDFGLAFDRVSFAAPDGTDLRGWWVPAERPRAAVILLHGFGSDRTELLPHAPYLHEAGFDLLLFDLRACGESGGELSTLGWLEQDDLRAAIDLVVVRAGGRPIFAMGHSLGSATAILEGATDPRLRAFVVEAPFTSIDDIVDRSFPHFSRPSLPSFPFAPLAVALAEARLGRDSSTIRPLDAIGRLAPRPLLIVTGTGDEVIPPPDAQRLYAAAGVGAEWWLIQGAGHPGSVDEPYVVAPDEYRLRVLRLFEGALAASTD